MGDCGIVGGVPTGHPVSLKVDEICRVAKGQVVPGLEEMIHVHIAWKGGCLGSAALLVVANINLFVWISFRIILTLLTLT